MRTRSSLFTAFVFLGMFIAAMVFINSNNTAHANHIAPPPSAQMPASLRNWMRSVCGHIDISPIIVTWISPRGAPTSVGPIEVANGASSVNLTLHTAGIVCEGTDSDAWQTRIRPVFASSTNFPAAVTGWGGEMILEFRPNWETNGTFSQASDNFTYSPSGGFNTPGPHNLQVRFDLRGINWYEAPVPGQTQHQCIILPAPFVNGFDYFGCPQWFVDFGMIINVPPPDPPPPEPEPATLGCSAATFPSNPAPGQDFSLRAVFTTSGGSGPDLNYRMRVTLSAAGGLNELYIGTISRNGRVTENIDDLSIGSPGRHSGNIRIDARPASGTTNGPIFNCPFEVQVPRRPFFRTFGGDTIAGYGFQGTNGGCTDSSARIIGWNRGGTGDFDTRYSGAGAQLAAFAHNQINSFASAQMRYNGGASPRIPKGLTFANTNPSFGSYGGNNTFGGGFQGGLAACAHDYYARAGSAENVITQGTINKSHIADSGTYRRNGNLTINSINFNLGDGTRVVYVNGNVTIAGPIRYTGNSNPPFASVDLIPGFRLIVRGNIYIRPSVSRLDGVYIAQRTSGNNGRIYTCAPGNGPPNANQLAGVCNNNQLTVYGAFVADAIKLTRSRGDYSSDTNPDSPPSTQANNVNAAEVFIMTPEVWLTADFARGNEYDAITTLPPIL